MEGRFVPFHEAKKTTAVVFGDPTVAAAGKLVCVPAGPASSVAHVLPYLTGVIAQDVINLSDEEPGQASLLKMIGNVMIMSTMEMVAEVNVFAEKTGLGAANAQRLVEAFPKAASMLYSKRMNNGDYYQGEVRFFPVPLSFEQCPSPPFEPMACLSPYSPVSKCPKPEP